MLRVVDLPLDVMFRVMTLQLDPCVIGCESPSGPATSGVAVNDPFRNSGVDRYCRAETPFSKALSLLRSLRCESTIL